MTSCTQMPCSNVDMQLNEIKDELKCLKNMVDFAVKLLMKLVPASIDDFQNILNGSTGLTITTAPPVVMGEADRLEIEAIRETIETEQATEAPGVIVQINSSPTSPKEDASSSSSKESPCSVDIETTTVYGGGSITKLQTTVKNASNYERDLVHIALECDNSDFSGYSRNKSVDICDFDSAQIVCTPHIPSAEAVGDKTENDKFSNTLGIESNVCTALVDMEPQQEQRLCASKQFNLENLFHTSVPYIDTESNRVLREPQIAIPSSNPAVSFDAMTLKEELHLECSDKGHRMEHKDDVKVEPEVDDVNGIVAEYVWLKNEEETSGNYHQEGEATTTQSDIYKQQIISALNTSARDDIGVYNLGHGITLSQEVPKNQIPSALKPLFGSALVSKLKQKIQEKIKAAVVSNNEENSKAENESDNANAKSCINLSLAANDLCENSKQIMVAESKRRPKFYQCKSCGKIFFCTIALQAHKNNCSGLRRQFHCSSCPLIFKSRAVFYNHKRLHAKKLFKSRHKCDPCGREFILQSTLRKHKQSKVCTGSKMKIYKKFSQYFCVDCGEGFLNAGNLALHQKLHSVDKNSTVDNEEINEQDISILQTNRRTRRHPCSYCEEAFIDRRSVTLHEKLHTDQEFAAFDQERKLIQRRHQLLMMMQERQQKSSEKKFGCKVCGRCYPIQLLLDMHTRLHHAIS